MMVFLSRFCAVQYPHMSLMLAHQAHGTELQARGIPVGQIAYPWKKRGGEILVYGTSVPARRKDWSTRTRVQYCKD